MVMTAEAKATAWIVHGGSARARASKRAVPAGTGRERGADFSLTASRRLREHPHPYRDVDPHRPNVRSDSDRIVAVIQDRRA